MAGKKLYRLPRAARRNGRPTGSRDRCGAARRINARTVAFVVLAFADSIRRAREGANVAVEELAAAIGMNPSSLYGYERGDSRPSLTTLVAIAMALRVPVDHLVPEV